MILLESDLETDFGITIAAKDQLPKGQWYDWLCKVRAKHQKEQSILIEESLQDATEKDGLTHKYFDSLLAGNKVKSMEQFKNLYQLIKKPPVPSSVHVDLALVIDVTGSMAPYAQSTVSTIENLLRGRTSLISKLSTNFPDIEFQLRVGCLCFRDIDDGANKFIELELGDGSHFTNDISAVLDFVKSACASPSGGFDLAEDIVGAIHRSANWKIRGDWTSDIKFMMLFSDAAAHGHLPTMQLVILKGLPQKMLWQVWLPEMLICSFAPLILQLQREQRISYQNIFNKMLTMFRRAALLRSQWRQKKQLYPPHRVPVKDVI